MSETETRDKLVAAAERLFAERGADNVSLREINRAAGQKNVAALHYHFGSRRALLVAIFERRMAGINQRRLELLKAVTTSGRDSDVRAIVEAMILPLAEQLSDPARGSHYVRFLAQAVSDPNVDVGDLIRGRFDHGVAATRRLLRAILTDLPPPVTEQRLDLASKQMVYALADRERHMAKDDRASADLWLFIDNLIDSVAAMLTAPVSRETQQRLSEQQKLSA
ncbi:MAG: TetR family transcriptional regulator [Alphaproteobacteria bacterium]|nr:TetR family transcriptional regulator [Alphaproteobacteria bacterium]